MADVEPVEGDTSDASQAPRPQKDPPPHRPGWKRPAGAAAVTAVLSAVGLAGYLGVHTVPSHPSPPSTSSFPDQVAGLPRGASSCQPIQTDVQVQFDLGARGTPATSCPFVEQVRKAYAGQNSPTSAAGELIVVSPTTSKSYKLACLSSTTYVTCTGGVAAVIYLYNRPGSRGRPQG